MEQYYTAREASRKLGISKSTFNDLVKANEIPRVTMQSSKRVFYPGQRIEELAEERARMLDEVARAPERIVFVLPERNDLEQLVDIERLFFHESIIVPAEEQWEQLTYNPEVIHVLKDSKTNTVAGGISISPIKPRVLEKLINLEIDETQIKPEDFLPYTTDQPLDCYIIDFAVRPGLLASYYRTRLMKASLDYFIELLNRGVVIRRIYAAAITKSGEQLTKGLHFRLLKSDLTREHEEFRHAYMLDLEDTASNSRLLKPYLKQKQDFEKRRKRYKKQG